MQSAMLDLGLALQWLASHPIAYPALEVLRITGIALYLGTIILAAWLIGAAVSPSAFASVEWVLGSILGRIVLFGYTWALLHHMLGGMKHLVWDTGYGFGPEAREQLTLWTLIGSVALTLVVWIVAYVVR